MKFVSPLSNTDLQVLNDTYMQGEKRALRRRAHAILLSSKGQISDILAVRRGTVSIRLNAWKADGLESLTDKAHTGRPLICD